MINDPLIPQATDSAPAVGRPARTNHANDKKSKRRPPARSAKILAVGLSTTAMLGMTTGYAFADFAKKQQELPVDPSIVEAVPGAQNTGSEPPRSTDGATNGQSPSTAQPPAVAPAPSTPTPRQDVVIEIPVPQAGNGSSNWGNQKSSGSN